MQIRFHIHEKYEYPEIVICGHEMNEELKEIAESVAQAVNRELTGYADGEASVLRQSEIVRIYAERQKIIAETANGRYALRTTLHELEEQLEKGLFVRISKSEIVNIKKIKKLDTSIAGTVRIFLQGGMETYVSRRNIPMIRKMLLGGDRE